MIRRLFPLFCLLGLAAAAPPPPRVELPIKMIVDRGGVRRFAVTLRINGTPIEAGLDTGSTGLRMLAPALPGGAGLHGEPAHYGYGSGTEFQGPAVKATLGLGTLPGASIYLQRIDRVGCRKKAPNCRAKDADLTHYGIMSDGVAGQGFSAIFGIGLHADTVPNPLVQSGVTRWIVDLPRSPGETGRLVLNPGDDEVARYKQIRFIADENQVVGCVNSAGTKLCAPTMIDTGASGIRVQGGKPSDVLPKGTEAVLVIGDGKASAALPVTIGRRDQAAGMRLMPPRANGKLSLSFGIAPYLRWSILYDARARTIGVADR